MENKLLHPFIAIFTALVVFVIINTSEDNIKSVEKEKVSILFSSDENDGQKMSI